MLGKIVVVGASAAGCRLALAAHSVGQDVTLVDEHPQAMKDMSFDAPWFYGAGLPSALLNDNSIAQALLEGSPELVECLEAGVDIRVSTILWGAFRNGPNCVNVGRPRVGLVTRDGNEILEHDSLIIATGVRDFVPSFKGWELPGVFGGKAGIALLDLYQVFEGRKVVVLGTSELALRFIRSALSRGVEIVAVIEAGDEVAAGIEAAEWLSQQTIPVHLGHVLQEAKGSVAVTGARCASLDGSSTFDLDCDSIAVAIATLPNIELPAAMGCKMQYDPNVASWVPEINAQGETSLENVFWAANDRAVDALLERINGAEPDAPPGPPPAASISTLDYIKAWISALHQSGDDAVTLCQCESVSRGEFCGIAPPAYLGKELRNQQTPVNQSDSSDAPRINQDFMKRMTRVSMGHCQGKRCRDEAVVALSLRFGCDVEAIRPASYRFPLRPIDLGLIADDDESDEIRLNWQMWPYETRQD
ncbi:FAD-dependent oxidoreductase [Rhizobium sp. NZLR1]|uniref:FAD-dependent oxidoreductase n=1 Tax=Rhizobium sp. NZLR1 TaxID=2731096 RepID=UPI001A984EB9|nr:FAD-dependent oxidoreductase [Rhizobium sp. NZLR1]MBX5204119.1 FAD-dependent oxidoreductase [Rhizobium sp. NZLR1]QSZ25090.1 FAD-dependent oxidoreductase [Rhizobium sp. NZLR1]